jgi:hypothetical protein
LEASDANVLPFFFIVRRTPTRPLVDARSVPNDAVPLFLTDDTLPAFVVVVVVLLVVLLVVAPTKSSSIVVVLVLLVKKHFLRWRAASLPLCPLVVVVLLVPKPLKRRFSDARELVRAIKRLFAPILCLNSQERKR